MRITLPVLFVSVAAVTGCSQISESRLNPLNWFGQSTPSTVTAPPGELRPLIADNQRIEVVDARVAVTEITGLQIDRTPTGAIITAQGRMEGSGYFNAQLIRVGLENGVLTYVMRAQAPDAQTGGSQIITAAETLDSAQLAAVRSVRIEGATNAQVVSR